MENTQDWIDLIEDAIGKDIEREIDSFLRKL